MQPDIIPAPQRARIGRPPGTGKWSGAKLETLRKAYEADAAPLKEVCHAFNIDRGTVMKLARRHTWKRRMSPQGIAGHVAAARRKRGL